MSFNAVHLPILTALASNSPISENRRTGRRRQCAEIWSSDRAITKGTYMDARLRDTAEAVESLPSFPIAKTEPRTLAPMLAPNVGNQGPLVSIPDKVDCVSYVEDEGTETKKPRETLGFTGFSEERLMRFELTTTTLATLCSTN